MRQIQPEAGKSSVFFKTLIQLYLLHLFLYYLTYCIKEGIKGNCFWRLNEKSVGLQGSYGLKQGNSLKKFKITNQVVLVIFISLLFDLLYQRGYQS